MASTLDRSGTGTRACDHKSLVHCCFQVLKERSFGWRNYLNSRRALGEELLPHLINSAQGTCYTIHINDEYLYLRQALWINLFWLRVEGGEGISVSRTSSPCRSSGFILNLKRASKQPMIERNPTNTMNNTLVFKINLPKKYALWCLHLTTLETHTWKIEVICLFSILKSSWAKTWYTQYTMLRKLGKDNIVVLWQNDWKIQQTCTLMILRKRTNCHYSKLPMRSQNQRANCNLHHWRPIVPYLLGCTLPVKL